MRRQQQVKKYFGRWEGVAPRDRALLLISIVMLCLGAGVSASRIWPSRIAMEHGSRPPGSERKQDVETYRSLKPVASPLATPHKQLPRCRPYHVVAAQGGTKAYVTLAGTESQPGREVVVVDVRQQRELRRIRVGSCPYGLAIHPSGRWLVVANRFSNYLSVIDVLKDQVVSRVSVPFYCEDLVFAADGETAYVTNFHQHQVLIVDLSVGPDRMAGKLRNLEFDRQRFAGEIADRVQGWTYCDACGWSSPELRADCGRCRGSDIERQRTQLTGRGAGGVRGAIRARCGNASCHLYSTGGFYAGPDDERLLQSVIAYSWPDRAEGSPLLRATTSTRAGGWADGTDGRHHPGGVVFTDPIHDSDYQSLLAWIAAGTPGPGISVGMQPRDLIMSADQTTLYVANTATTDISVVDLKTSREVRRIFTRSPVNDLLFVDGKLILATLGVGSGHPKFHEANRESLDPNNPEAEFTLFRDHATGRPLPLEQQQPLGPFDNVDGTRQQKFRDITNDVIMLDPNVNNVAAYRAEDEFTRYTSDSFEALAGDYKGDVPSELMKVVGAFPEQCVITNGHLYVTMSGTFQVQEWRISPLAPPAERLVPGRLFPTGFKPTGICVTQSTLVVANHLSESITFIDLDSGAVTELSLSRLPEPFPANDFERGEFFVQSSVFSVDQDQSCVHCHYRDASDGKRWSVSQVMGQNRSGEERTGGSREVPDLRNLVNEVPFFVEGTLSIDEPLTMIMEHNPLVDFQGTTPAGDFEGIYATDEEAASTLQSADAIVVATSRPWDTAKVRLADLVKRREVHFSRIARQYLGQEYSIRDFQRMIGEYQGGESRLLPNPADATDPMITQGEALFMSPQVGCAGCHPPPSFTDKTHVRYTQNKSFPPLVSAVTRDNVHTLVSADRIDAMRGFVRPWDTTDQGRVEEREGYFVAPSLRGLWARPPVFLHHGHAASLREVLCTPDHMALRRISGMSPDVDRQHSHETGMNENQGIPDTHGATSHLSIWEIECLIAFLNSIE